VLELGQESETSWYYTVSTRSFEVGREVVVWEDAGGYGSMRGSFDLLTRPQDRLTFRHLVGAMFDYSGVILGCTPIILVAIFSLMLPVRGCIVKSIYTV
jgi:hypothetical protein